MRALVPTTCQPHALAFSTASRSSLLPLVDEVCIFGRAPGLKMPSSASVRASRREGSTSMDPFNFMDSSVMSFRLKELPTRMKNQASLVQAYAGSERVVSVKNRPPSWQIVISFLLFKLLIALLDIVISFLLFKLLIALVDIFFHE